MNQLQEMVDSCKEQMKRKIEEEAEKQRERMLQDQTYRLTLDSSLISDKGAEHIG